MNAEGRHEDAKLKYKRGKSDTSAGFVQFLGLCERNRETERKSSSVIIVMMCAYERNGSWQMVESRRREKAFAVMAGYKSCSASADLSRQPTRQVGQRACSRSTRRRMTQQQVRA
jgi:hypothetical protein